MLQDNNSPKKNKNRIFSQFEILEAALYNESSEQNIGSSVSKTPENDQTKQNTKTSSPRQEHKPKQTKQGLV